MSFLKRVAIPLSVLVIFGFTLVLAFTLKRDHGVDIGKKIGLSQRLGNRLPLNTTFTNEYGKKVQLSSYFGKHPVLMMLDYFACQAACQVQFENAAQTFSNMKPGIGTDFDVISLSIDSRETPELARMKKADVMAGYSRPGGFDGWHFLTGRQDQIRKVADALGYKYYYNPKQNQILHPTGLFILTKDGRLSRTLFGVDYVSSMVADSISTAAAGKINVPSDPILFGCLQFDPSTGRIRVDVYRSLQVAGCAMVLLVIGMVLYLIRTGPKRTKLYGGPAQGI